MAFRQTDNLLRHSEKTHVEFLRVVAMVTCPVICYGIVTYVA